MKESRDITALFVLLRAGLWEREADDLSPFPLSSEEWAGLFRTAERQTVAALVCRGLSYLPHHLLPPQPVLVRQVALTDAVERKNRRMNEALSVICRLCHRHGLHPVLQKGQGVAQFYEDPLLRECGDIDLYFPDASESRMAARLLPTHPEQVYTAPDKAVTYRHGEILVEQHPVLFDLGNPFLRKYLRKLEAEEGFDEITVPVAVAVPSPLLNLLLLDTHILKHALGWGIGLRQLCDMARACHRLHDGVDAGKWEAACRKAGIRRWNRLLFAFLTEYLGLPADCLPGRGSRGRTARPLLDIVLEGGNFGLYRRNAGGLPRWKRKWHTACSFLRNALFALRHAPKEACWTFINLTIGQFR